MKSALLAAALSALMLAGSPAFAQTKVTNEGISPAEIVVGSHQDLSGPIKGWGVPVSNGMKMAVEETNARPPRTAGEIVTDEDGSGATALTEFLASKKFI